jgi:Pyruvate/2-oxoglutarate dehydrogenase complex, dihydrolipoamide dehydrogenase (E3) component, and related enzymes
MPYSLGVIIILSSCNTTPKQYDLCIYGATSSGVVAAYTAAQLGMNVVLVEPTNRVGGLTTGGLGYTDIGNKQAIKGVALDFFQKSRQTLWLFRTMDI